MEERKLEREEGEEEEEEEKERGITEQKTKRKRWI